MHLPLGTREQGTDTGPGGIVTVEDTARHILANADVLQTYWLIESAALSLTAISAFTLQSRQRSTVVPTGWFWTAVGLGAALNLVMYVYTVGVYPAAASVAETQPALLQSARGASFFLFFLANAVMMLGLAGVFLGELLDTRRVLGRWLCLAGALFSAASFAGAILGLTAGPFVMGIVGPIALVATLLAALLGIGIARRG